MLRGLPSRNEEGWWSGHLGLLLLVGSFELQQRHSLRHTYCMNAQDKYHVCTCTNVRDARGMHMLTAVRIFQVKLYSIHFTYQVYTT